MLPSDSISAPRTESQPFLLEKLRLACEGRQLTLATNCVDCDGSGEASRTPAAQCLAVGSLCSLLPYGGASHTETFWFFRLLLQLTQSQQTSFALEKNLRSQQEIAGKLKEFDFREDTLLLMEEVCVPSDWCRAKHRGDFVLFPN